MKKIWIFGDSYSDVKYKKDQQISWPEELDKKYDVSNFSRCGTGPDYSLSLLNREISKSHNLKDVSLIFFVSSIYRFNFNFYNTPEDQVLYTYVGWPRNLNKDAILKTKKYLKYRTFCKHFFEFYSDRDDFNELEVRKIIGSLKLYETFFEKILIWPIFQKPKTAPVQSNKFYYVDRLLQYVEDNQLPKIGEDTRANHLSEENHIIMLEQMSNWIDYNIPIDISKFVKFN